MLYLILLLAPLLNTLATCSSKAQAEGTKEKPEEGKNFTVMFYNVENLFDTQDDPLTDDDNFTPKGSMHWTLKRYHQKLANISKVIITTGGWTVPDIVGLCEIENHKVVFDLIHQTPLSQFYYEVIHYESGDHRGIDVALLYNRQTVRLIHSMPLPIRKKGLATRDILYAKFLIGKDTCHIFVNHWPSRSAGQLETEMDRFSAAAALKYTTDSLMQLNKHAKILIMGDFNDDPTDESITQKLGASQNLNKNKKVQLFNLTRVPVPGFIQGTLKYKGAWNLFDQIIVSEDLLFGKGIVAGKDSYAILNNQFLLESDRSYTGFKPYRTYYGFRYHGGFSDHLPVYLKLFAK